MLSSCVSREQREIPAPQELPPLPPELQGGRASPQHTGHWGYFSTASVLALQSLDPHGSIQGDTSAEMGSAGGVSQARAASHAVLGWRSCLCITQHLLLVSAHRKAHPLLSGTLQHRYPLRVHKTLIMSPGCHPGDMGLASPIPCERSSSEMQLTPGTRVLWKETTKSPWFVSSPQVVIDYEDLPKTNSSVQTAVKDSFGKWTESHCAWSNMRERTVRNWEAIVKQVWLLSSCLRDWQVLKCRQNLCGKDVTLGNLKVACPI